MNAPSSAAPRARSASSGCSRSISRRRFTSRNNSTELSLVVKPGFQLSIQGITIVGTGLLGMSWEEVPRLAAWLRGGRGPLGVDVYAVASATKREAPNYPPSAWLKREGWPAPVLVDDEKGTAAMAVGLSGYPFFVLVDRAGAVVHRHSGETSIPELERLIARVRGA